jgi:pyrroline-5-carboxylate reductase
MSQQKNMQNSNAHITFIGGGNMGRALISGLLANGFEPNQISVVEANAVTAQSYMKTLVYKVLAL